ncbi:hypothetical protein MT994_06730 [Cellulosimicrobium sp. MI9406]|uniref:hypothetical protein n=1 Tax=Cellulosimicrobium sp. MI9406 TaxID=2931398 RepID=UPI0033A59EDD
MSTARARRRAHGLAGALLVAALSACSGPGGLVTACPAVGYSARLEVRLDDSWPDRDAYGVTVACVGADPCALVRDGTLRPGPEPAPTTIPVDPVDPANPVDPVPPQAVETSPEQSEGAQDAPSVGEWTGSALNGPVGTVVVRVVEVASGDVVVEREIDPTWESADGADSECGGPSVATIEVAAPPG